MAQPIKRRHKPDARPNFLRPVHFSQALQKVLNHPGPLPKTEITKKLWEYIKNNGLQDKLNRRMINCDATLQTIFNKNQVSMFEMTRLVSNHIVP